MKIFYLANIRIPTEKAHGLQIIKSCEAFAAEGLYVELVVPFKANSIKEDAFAYYGSKKIFSIKKLHGAGFLSNHLFSNKLTFYIQSVIFSLVAIAYVVNRKEKNYIFYSRDYLTLFFLCLFGLKTVAEIHDYRLEEPSWIVGFVFKKSWKIILNSSGTLNKIKSHYKLDESRALVVPNGVDLENFEINVSKEHARTELKIPQEETIIAYIGRIETAGVDKGVGLLLDAFNLIKDELKNVTLYVIGGPNERMGNSAGRVVFTGHVPHGRIPLYLTAIDLAVIPLPPGKHAETTSPIKLFEFMAAGQAIVVPDFPSFREIVDDSAVFFYKPGDVESLASTIKTALENRESMVAKAKKAKELSKEFTWRKRARKIINFI